MRLLTNLLYKVTLSSMILTAPAMISGRSSFESYRPSSTNKKGLQPGFAATVIKRFVNRPTVIAMRAWPANAPAYADAAESGAASPATAAVAMSAATAASLPFAATVANSAEPAASAAGLPVEGMAANASAANASAANASAANATVANAANATAATATTANAPAANTANAAANSSATAAATRANTAAPVASSETKHAGAEPVELHPAEIAATFEKSAAINANEATTTSARSAATVTAKATTIASAKAVTSASVRAADAKAAELRTVVRQATLIYTAMDLQRTGLDSKAFEYAWRGYHNLVKKGLVHKSSILSICDFSQSSRSKRMYVIDVEHKRLLYRTYVAHGQNSGDEFASNFSNDNDSYMSSLGFYITQGTYMGRNGLSLRLDGVDRGYNDNARKRMIVLHGSAYAGEKYMEDYGNLGTSLGCPALPAAISGRIIRAVKDGSCLFIYHPTQQYLENSTVLHG
jgi:hypothetical protein